MKTNKNQLLRKFKNLSRVLTHNSSMKVTFSGKGAYHTSGHINLPMGDFADEDFITMSLGYCDHELGHEQYTNGNFYQLAATRHPFMVRLLNALDDVHQENRMFADFRGTRISLRKLVELCKVKGVFCLPPEDNHALVLKGWVLYKGRSELLEQPVADLFQQTDVMMKNLFGDEFHQKCHHILRSDVLNSLGTTEACFNVAEAIWEAFAEWMDEQEREQEGSDDSEGSDDDSQEASDGAEGSDDSEGSDDDSQEASDGAEGSDDSDGADDDSQEASDRAEGSDDSDGADDDSQEASDGAEGSDDSDGADDGSQEASDGAEGSDDSDGADDGSQEASDGAEGSDGAKKASVKAKIIEEIEEMSSEDEHAEIIKIINEMAADGEESVELIEPLGLLNKCMIAPQYRDKLIDSDCHRLVAKMKNPLKRVFHDQNFVNFSHKNRGKSISSTRLAGVAVGNTKVFESECIHRSPNAVVGLLVDKSFSMEMADMKMANSVAYSLSETLDSIHGVKSIVGYYPTFESENDYQNSYCGIVKSFEAKPNINNFLVMSSGGTPTAEAVCSMTSLLTSRAEPRKLLFVITDGDPNCVESTKLAIEEAQAVGVKVFGIGIKGQVAGFDGADFEAIHSKEELLDALTKKLKHAFI